VSCMAKGKNSESDPGNTQHESETVGKAEDEKMKTRRKKKDAKGGEEHEKKEKKPYKEACSPRWHEEGRI
jgi:hypothetical protein